MPSFSQTSLSKLNTCHPDLIALFQEVVKTFDCTVVYGWRGEVAQNEAYRTGHSTKPWPLSKHNTTQKRGDLVMPLSQAVDVVPYPVDWKDEKRIYFFAGFVLAIAQTLKAKGIITSTLRQGADWNGDKQVSNEKFPDACHFEVLL